ncbi:hypothetical protein D3C80_1234270 [compost metagenome]
MSDGEGRQWHHAAVGIAHVEVQDILHLQARAVVGLNDHALHAPGARIVVDVGRAEVCRDGIVDVGEGDAERVGLLAVDHQQHLGRIGKTFHAHARHDLALCSLRHQVARCFSERRLPEATAVLKTERETSSGAETFDRRRRQGEGCRILQCEELHIGAVGDFLDGIAFTAFRPVLHGDEGQSGVRAIA